MPLFCRCVRRSGRTSRQRRWSGGTAGGEGGMGAEARSYLISVLCCCNRISPPGRDRRSERYRQIDPLRQPWRVTGAGPAQRRGSASVCLKSPPKHRCRRAPTSSQVSRRVYRIIAPEGADALDAGYSGDHRCGIAEALGAPSFAAVAEAAGVLFAGLFGFAAPATAMDRACARGEMTPSGCVAGSPRAATSAGSGTMDWVRTDAGAGPKCLADARCALGLA
jgi:hypothetical protein